MFVTFKKIFLAGTLIIALVGCSDTTANQNTNSLSETSVNIPSDNETTSTNNKELTFNEIMKKYKETKSYS